MNRRSFIRTASLAAAGHAAGLRPFGMMNAFAQGSSDYKALVCIFLFGGNDANNTIIPFDTADYASYAKIRGPLALAQNTLLPLTPLPNYALNPNLPDIQSLFNNGKAAIVANVGTLVQPLTRAQYLASQSLAPSSLFSHPDQQLQWQNYPQSGATPTGWAGRIADYMTPIYNPNGQVPMVTSCDGDTLFCDGASTSPVAVIPGSVQAGKCSESSSTCQSRQATAQQILTFESGVSLVQADNDITANAYKYDGILATALQSVTLQTKFPNDGALGSQLQQIAQMIKIGPSLGINRQIFFAGVGNFDTHAAQLSVQSSLLAMISPAIGAFYAATQELGVANQVTTFTMSDFNRAYQPNGNNGSDHAWGSNLFVLGGAVKGGKVYGTMPTLALGGPDDSGSNGRWVPTTASVQYAATLASWFGVPAAELANIFPNIGNFPKANLGFVG
ncbi:hypothetical protein ACPOL_6845 (plasmid) [Acidisarcina polymorpha]|uniref:Tat (Twin-arginine translocation) pathway signal sequence domain protein n=1 Tax=Acidisarcina polymorpha TaxID=2211140 RepID=A0A2Z5GBS6_9BACT|nr:DUF1501 domain-containing protein [Acidisarcina polymorpha]AXC16055.1 hypothetical protein ACPOL_6845 [Acidisarcina polymorpha]